MSRGSKRAVVLLSDSDDESAENTRLEGNKSRKLILKKRALKGIAQACNVHSSDANGAIPVQSPESSNVDNFYSKQASGGAFAWPSFQPPAKKAKQDPGTANFTNASCQLPSQESQIHTLWFEKYFPTLEEELAVHKKKVVEVRAWFESQQQQQESSKVLLLVGPPGVGKSTTIRVLCAQLSLQLVEWQTPVPTLWEEHVHHKGVGPQYSSKLDEFDTFLDKAEKFPSVPLVPTLATLSLNPSKSSAVKAPNTKSQSLQGQPPVRGKVVLIDDMPLAAEGERRQRLCNSLETLAQGARFPTVVILSKGEAGQSGHGEAQPSWGATAAFQQALERGGATKVSFNPVTSANIRKVLLRVASSEWYDPPEEDLSAIAEESRGDLRQALTSLQFHCVGQSRSKAPVKNGKKWRGATAAKRSKKRGKLSNSEERQNGTQPQSDSLPQSQPSTSLNFGSRDSSISLFHALGKFLYNKRGDADVSGDVGTDTDIHPALRRRPMASLHPPEATLARAHLDGPAVTAFLHENLLQFVDDDAIDDVSTALSYISDADHILRRRAGGIRATPAEDQGTEPDPGRVGQAAAASIAARGVLFGVTHPVPRKWQALRAPVSGQVERRRGDTLAQIHRASLLESSRYIAPGAAGSTVLLVELLPCMKQLDAVRKASMDAMRQESSTGLTGWTPYFEIDRRKGSVEFEEDAEDIEEW